MASRAPVAGCPVSFPDSGQARWEISSRDQHIGFLARSLHDLVLKDARITAFDWGTS
jgi:hypothetical protein